MNDDKKTVDLNWNVPKEEVFKRMIKDHYARYISSLFHILIFWALMHFILGPYMGAFIVVFLCGVHLGGADQRLNILSAEFSDKLGKHKIFALILGIVLFALSLNYLTVTINSMP